MRSRPLLAVALLSLAALHLAGCVSKTAVTGEVAWSGESARVSDGWAYDGKGLRPAEGTVSVRVNDRSNTGEVKALVEDGFNTWRVEWTTFSASNGFQDGGIVRNLVEHGASGTGDGSIPEVRLLVAGWGNAKLYRNGELVRDPATGDESLSAHFMVIDGELRSQEGVIYNKDRTAPYSPALPADGSVATGGPQIFVQLKSANPESFQLVLEFRSVRGA